MNRICFIVCALVVLFISQVNISAKNLIHWSNLTFQKDTIIKPEKGVWIITEEMPVFGEKIIQKKKKKENTIAPFQKYILMGSSFSDTIQIPKPPYNQLTKNSNCTKSCSH